MVSLACAALGIAGAWASIRLSLPLPRLWPVLLVLPLAVPSYISAYAWLSAFPGFGGFGGSALVLTLASLPYVVLPVAAALRGLDPALEEVARSAGSGPWTAFRRVVLPQLWPATAAGSLLVALYVLSDFGAVSVLRYDVFTRVIHSSYRSSFDRTPAAVLGCLLVLLTLVLVAFESRAARRAPRSRTGGGAARRMRRVRPRPAVRFAVVTGLVALTALSLGVPAWSLTVQLIEGSSSVDTGRLAAAAFASLRFSAFGALVTLLLALPVGLLAARRREQGLATLPDRITWLGHALPGIVIGLSLVFLCIRVLPSLYQRTPVLVFAYAVLFLPLAVAAVRSAAAQAPPVFEEVARSLGRPPRRVLTSITLPLATPGLLAGAALVFLTCMKELPATLLLHPTGTETLATDLWSHTGVGAYAAAAPYAAALVLLASVPTALLSRPNS